jgi:hypothetical protein
MNFLNWPDFLRPEEVCKFEEILHLGIWPAVGDLYENEEDVNREFVVPRCLNRETVLERMTRPAGLKYRKGYHFRCDRVLAVSLLLV